MFAEAVLTTLAPVVHQGHLAQLAYRPDIDGLRALAVLAVLLYHAWPNWFGAGFVGVDIFFVISGFLITSILLADLENGHFSIAGFYARRVRRIFPALALVLLATVVFGWGVLLHDEFVQLGRHTLAGAAFVSNLLLWREAGYFDNDAVTKPLLHLWSLGVEEQFYIVWPLLLWMAARRRWRFLWLAGLLFALSMAANLLLLDAHPVAAFFSPLTRFWELMAGGAAAWLLRRRAPWFESRALPLSLGGALLLVLAFSLCSAQLPYPGYRALLPVGGAWLLILAGPRGLFNRLLGRRLPVAVGLISYPLYLWHWPLLAFAHIVQGGKPAMQIKLAMLALSLVLAVLTYRFVELPLRARRGGARVTVVFPLAGAMLVVALAGVAVNASLVRERIDTTGAAPYLAALNDSDFPGPTLAPLRYQGVVFQKVGSRAPGLTVFLGDSVMQQYGPRIAQLISSAPQRYNSVIFATAGGCPPIEHTVRVPQLRFPLCPRTVRAAYALANSAQVDTVVVGAAWYGYFNDSQRELMYDDGRNVAAFPAIAAQELAYASLAASLARLRASGKRVYLVLQPPAGAAFNPQNMVTGSRFAQIRPLATIAPFDLDDYQKRNAAPLARLTAIASDAGAIVIEPAQTMCRGATCPVLDEAGAPLYTDGVHMRPAYSRRAATFIDQTIARVAPAN